MHIAEMPSTRLSPAERIESCQRVFTAMTAIMDEEAVLEASHPRKIFLADCGDLRAPLGLALASLIAYERTGHPDLRSTFLRMWDRSTAAFRRMQDSCSILTATQCTAFATVQVECTRLFPEMKEAVAAGVPEVEAAPSPSFAIAIRIFDALSAMLDVERAQDLAGDRKRVVACIVNVRGPLGLAVSYLQDYADTQHPASRRLFT